MLIFQHLMKSKERLTKRESEVMDAAYSLGEASAAEIGDILDSPPSNAALRSLLGILVDKGLLGFRKDGRRFIYSPTTAREQAGSNALMNTLKTFFDGSLSKAVAGMLTNTDTQLSDEEIKHLEQIIKTSKEK